MIVDNSGGAWMELPGWQHVRATIFADQQGNLQLGLDPTLTHPDGTTEPLTLTGTLVNGRMVGTTNGGAIDVSLTDIQDTVLDPATKQGSWISTASSTGQVMRLHLKGDFSTSYNLAIDPYATAEDAAAQTNQMGSYYGTLRWSDGDTTHTRNCLQVGLMWSPVVGQNWGPPGIDLGMAYFAPDGTLVILTAQTHNGQSWPSQISAIFTKE